MSYKGFSAAATTIFLAAWLLALWLGVGEAGHGTEDFVDTVAVERVKLLLDTGEKLILIDLRATRDFQQARLPGARSVPMKEIEKRIREIPKAGRVILYCDCPQNEIIQNAYQPLRDDFGYRNLAIMPDGFKEWLKRKYPIETGRK